VSSGFGDQPQDQFGPGPFNQGQFSQGPFNQGQPQTGPGQFAQSQFGQGQSGWPPPPPYGPGGPYVQVGAGWPQMAGRRTNSLAIAALCCSIGQVIAGPFAGIAAIVLGTISLKQIRVSGEDGRGMAMTGLILGIVGTILAVAAILFFIAVFHDITTNVNNFNGVNVRPTN